MNRTLVLEIIRSSESISQAELVGRTQLSVGTIVSIVRELKEGGFVHELGPGWSQSGHRSKLGRRPVQLSFNSAARYVVAAEIGPDEVTMALMNLTGSIVRTSVFRIDAGRGPAVLFREFPSQLKQLLTEGKVDRARVVGVGVATPGITDATTGRLILSKHLGWRDVPLKQRLEALLRLPVLVDSEAPLMALGEQRWGAGRGAQHLVLVENDVGIGAGLFFNGKVVRGFQGMAGELGQDVNWTTENQGDNEQGRILEDVASGTAMIESARQAHRQGRTKCMAELLEAPLLRPGLRILYAAAGQGDQVAIEIVRRAAAFMGAALANIINLLDPELIILAGSTITESKGMLLTLIREHARKHVLNAPNRLIRIEEGLLGDRASLVGAATLVYDHFFSPGIGTDLATTAAGNVLGSSHSRPM